jgi:hypothetical protein
MKYGKLKVETKPFFLPVIRDTDTGNLLMAMLNIPNAEDYAHLFAAAPDLLEALDELLDDYIELAGILDSKSVKAIRAIAKATGKEADTK